MQIVEQTGFGVRTGVVRMVRSTGGPTFLLFPILHLGTPAYYKEVQKRLLACDVLVLEGLAGRRGGVITLAYRIAGWIRRDGVVLQSKGIDLSDFQGTLVRPDASAEEFGAYWRAVSLGTRCLIYLAAPMFGMWVALVGPRRALGKDLAVDDLPSDREEELAHEALDEALLHSRDALLIKALNDLLDHPDKDIAVIGVCWGATHIRAVVHALHARGYIARSGEWLMAIPPRWARTR